MAANENPVKARMAAGDVALGMNVRVARSGDVARIAKSSGHDFLFIDMQHALYGVETVGRPVKRCETTFQSHREERIDGYRVTYRYKGQKYMTEMPYDPGRRMRVRVDIRPAA